MVFLFWRGWGLLVLAFLVLPEVIGNAVGGSRRMDNLAVGLLLLASAAAMWFLGRHLNITRVQRRVEPWMAQRTAEVDQAVEAGTFAPGGIRPTSLVEARAQAAAMLADERQQLTAARGNHSFFFIPMQWWGVVAAAFGLVNLVAVAF